MFGLLWNIHKIKMLAILHQELAQYVAFLVDIGGRFCMYGMNTIIV